MFVLEDVNGTYAQQFSDLPISSASVVQINATNNGKEIINNPQSTQKGKI